MIDLRKLREKNLCRILKDWHYVVMEKKGGKGKGKSPPNKRKKNEPKVFSGPKK